MAYGKTRTIKQGFNQIVPKNLSQLQQKKGMIIIKNKWILIIIVKNDNNNTGQSPTSRSNERTRRNCSCRRPLVKQLTGKRPVAASQLVENAAPRAEPEQQKGLASETRQVRQGPAQESIMEGTGRLVSTANRPALGWGSGRWRPPEQKLVTWGGDKFSELGKTTCLYPRGAEFNSQEVAH